MIDFMNAHRVHKGLVEDEVVESEDVHFRVKRYVEDDKIVKEIFVKEGEKELKFYEKVALLTIQDFEELFKKAQLKGDSEKVARFQARAALLQGEISKQGGPDLGFLSGQNKKPVNPFKNPNNQNNNAQATTPNATAVVPAATATAANPAVAAAAAAAAAAANPAAATTPLPMSSPTAPVPSTNPKAPTSSPANTPKVPPTTSNSKAIPQFTFTEGAIQIIGSGLEKEEVIEVAEVAVIGAIEKAVAGTA